MKKIKLLITLSLTLCVLAFGSISVFALDVTVGDIVPAGTYVFPDTFTVESLATGIQVTINFISNGHEYSSISFSADLRRIAFRPLFDDDPDHVWDVDSGWYNDSYKIITISDDFTIRDENDVFLFSFLNTVDIGSSGSGLAEDIFELFQSIIVWMVDFFGVFVGLFWTSTSGLTVLGVLSVIALGISIFFLIFAVVINFFRFRGR